MKKIRRILVGLALVFVALITLASCSKVSQSYADKINKAAENGENYTVETVRSDLGDEAIEVLVLNTGVIAAVKGYNKDNYKEKLDAADENTKFEFIVITFVAGKATAAAYNSGTAAQVKAALASK
ncbi:MAG: hypothetical protein IKP77_00300 [Acholeplasmatales bacterium]|nr:hypothetical protein [Acholeplasmatales bacterium]